MSKSKGLLERLRAGEHVVCAEGYLFEFERRGQLKAGGFVPEVVVERPDLVKAMHEEFVQCGSDVVEAFTYYGHREKMRLIGREDELEKLNRQALKIARQVADATGKLMAGNICNTTVYKPDDPDVEQTCRHIFEEQVGWAVEEGADYIIAETFNSLGEAKFALDAIKSVRQDMPAVITLAPHQPDGLDRTYDGVSFPEALRVLEERGADVVGLNCTRGPDTILPLMREIRKVCKGPLACLPVAYRTSEENGVSMQALRDQKTGAPSFPTDLDAWLLSRSSIASMTRELVELGVQYMGVCCGNRAGYIRTMAETLGRVPPASKYSPDMTQHYSQLAVCAVEFNNKKWNAQYCKH